MCVYIYIYIHIYIYQVGVYCFAREEDLVLHDVPLVVRAVEVDGAEADVALDHVPRG